MLIVKKDEGYFKDKTSAQPKIINTISKDDVLNLTKAIYTFKINNKEEKVSKYIDNNYVKIKNPVDKTIYKITYDLLENIFNDANNIQDDIKKSLIKLKENK